LLCAVKLSRRRLLALGATGALLAACRSAPSVVVSEHAFQGRLATERAPATPVPTPQPTAVVDDGGLQRELRAFLAEQQGAFGVAISDLHGPVTAAFDGDDLFQLGSLYKLVLLAEVMRQVKTGQIARGATVRTLPDYTFIEPQGGIPPGTRVPVEQALAAMVAVSSNAAALALTELVTPAELTAAPRRFGMVSTAIDVDVVGGPGHYSIDARGAARDFVGLLVKLDREELVGPEQDRRMVDLLLGQKIADRIPLLLPGDVPIAHKTADLDSYTHDAGLVYLPGRPYAIAILAQGLNLADGKAIVAEISRIAFAYFAARR
jgi:beta-lactamase class A